MAKIIVNDELGAIIGKDLESITAKLPADKEFVLVAKEDHIPKTRFDEVNTGFKEYKSKYEETAKQLEPLKATAQGNEELAKKIKELQDGITQTTTEYEGKLAATHKEYALTDAFKTHKARNPKAVRALLDETKITFKDGKLEGIDGQIEGLKKSDPYLFDIEQQTPPPFKFGNPSGQNPPIDQNDPLAAWFGLNKTKK
jgi:hypothetical protein